MFGCSWWDAIILDITQLEVDILSIITLTDFRMHLFELRKTISEFMINKQIVYLPFKWTKITCVQNL